MRSTTTTDPSITSSGLTREDLTLLTCPTCGGGEPRYYGTWRHERVERGALRCMACEAIWDVRGGVPLMVQESQVRGTDRLMRVIYDSLPSLHDPMTDHLLPLLEFDMQPTHVTRESYLKHMRLGELTPRAPGHPVRVLEVGIGGGANLPMLQEQLPPGLEVEFWGMDLSQGMLRQCQKRVERDGPRRTRLVLGDAHALPFATGAFDRVFHVGALGSFRDPGLALREMARVARPGTPIVAVDEQLDPARSHKLHHKLTFRLLTFYDDTPHCPSEELPEGATEVSEEQISRFYYCLSFTMPSERAQSAS
ncbi:MAG: SAM-dependent methyltransferase [Myxococcales bacterium]|nr:SAM-dependent methyltransferase [Myxococcales bacterium]